MLRKLDVTRADPGRSAQATYSVEDLLVTIGELVRVYILHYLLNLLSEGGDGWLLRNFGNSLAGYIAPISRGL